MVTAVIITLTPLFSTTTTIIITILPYKLVRTVPLLTCIPEVCGAHLGWNIYYPD
jgi:hypothetical protein